DLLRAQAEERGARCRREARLCALELAERAQVEVVGQRRVEILGVRSAPEGEPVGHADGERWVEVECLELREAGVIPADPPARPARLQTERRADAEAEADPVGEAVGEEEAGEGLRVAAAAALAPAQRRATDGF